MIAPSSRCPTYVRKEDARNASPRMQPLLVTFSGIRATTQASLVAGHRVLVCFDAPISSMTVPSYGH